MTQKAVLEDVPRAESISTTVTCTGEMSALTCVIRRGEGLNTPTV